MSSIDTSILCHCDMPKSNQNGSSRKSWLNNDNVSLLNEESSIDELHLVCLEERVLYSAVPVPIDLVEFVDVENSIGSNELTFEDMDMDQGLDLLENGLEQFMAESNSETDEMDLATSEFNASEVGQENLQIIFVDQSVEGYQQLVDDILNQSGGDIEFEVAFINGSSDGIQQVTTILNEQANSDKSYHAVHLVTHGSNATVNLGNTQVDSSNIHNYASDFVQWQNALTGDADILIYGCEVAQDEVGEQFVQELADLTGADVAASDDLTGHESLGGDWHFEVTVGTIEAGNVFSEVVQHNWTQTLEITGENGSATNGAIAVNSSQTTIQVFSKDLGSGNGLDIFYQITDHNGVQDAVQVNTTDASGDQQFASVAIDNDGDFVVVWTDQDVGGEQGVFAKYYAADGSLIRDEFRVDEIGSGGNDAAVDIDANGNFVIAWEGSSTADADGIFLQRFDFNGVEVGQTVLVNEIPDGLAQRDADVAINDLGQIVVTWDDFTAISVTNNIYGNVFDFNDLGFSTGTFLAAQNTVDEEYAFLDASVDINNSSNIVFSFTANQIDGGLAASFAGLEVGFSTFSFDGTNETAGHQEFSASEFGLGNQLHTSVTILENNQIVLAWAGDGRAENSIGQNQIDSDGAFFRTFDFSDSNSSSSDQFIDQLSYSGIQGTPVVASSGDEFVFGFNDDGDPLTLATSFNYAPTSQDSSITVSAGFEHTLQLSDFSFIDADNRSLDHVVLDSIPDSSIGQGQLQRNGVELNAGDTISKSEIQNGDITYLSDGQSLGIVGSIQYRVNDGTEFGNSATLQIENEFSDTLLFSFKGDQTFEGINFEGDDIVAFGGNDLQLGSPTTGQAYKFLDSTYDIDAFHLVGSSTTLDLATPITLNAGDILFSVSLNGTSIPGLGSVGQGDVILFQPDELGNFDPAQGTFSNLGNVHGDNSELNGLTLVESDTVIGDFTVTQGSLLAATSANENSVQLVNITSGAFSTQELFLGNEVDISGRLAGLELIEQETTIGGVTLAEGTLLLSVGGNEVEIGTATDTPVRDNDIFALQLTSTEIGSSVSVGEAAVIFDADTLANLQGGGNGDIDAISLVTQLDIDQSVVTNDVDVTEGDSVLITQNELSATHPTASAFQLTYTVTSAPDNGEILLSGVATTTFTQQDVDDELVSYQHNGSETTADSISFSVDEGDGNESVANVAINVSPVNDEQVLATNATLTINEGARQLITTSELNTTDVDTSPDHIVYSIALGPDNGTIRVNGSNATSFTQQQVIDGEVEYQHAGGENTFDRLQFSVDDGSGLAAVAFFDIDVIPQNDPPEEVFNETPLFNIGTSNNLISSTTLHFIDSESSPTEVVYTIDSYVSSGNSLLLGGTTLAVGDTFTQQNINDNLLRYSNGGSAGVSDSFTFTVSDGDDSLSDTFNIAINTIVNDAPLLNLGEMNINENSVGNIVTSVVLNATDPDDGPTELFYELRGEPGAGTLFRNGTALSTGDQFTQQDIINGSITYNHTDGSPGTDTVALTLRDGLEDGVLAQDFELQFNIGDVNEAPVVTTNSLLVAEGSNGNVLSNLNLNASDVDAADTADQLTYTLASEPSGGTLRLNGAALTAGQSFNQQDVDNNLVTYDHAGTIGSVDAIELTLSDGLEDGVAAQDVTVQIVVDQVNDPISDLSDGIEINSIGDDVYFRSNDGSFFANQSEFTYEISFASNSVGETTTLASYRSPTDGSANDDAFKITLTEANSLLLVINGNEAESLTYDYSQVQDGSKHNLAVSWNSDNGNWEVFVDGARIDYGTGLATGEAIRDGGTFVLGHEQDSVDGGYNNDNEFKGTLFDVRVWDVQQSAEEINQNQYVQFDASNLPGELAANWQFDNLGGGSTVRDVVGSNDLTLQRASGADFTLDTVRENLNVDENSANGTIVGAVIPTDAEFFQDLVSDGSFTSADLSLIHI